MKKLILILIVIFCTKISAQIAVGTKHDLDGIPLDGYYDPILYAPNYKINKTNYLLNKYQYGYYYDASQNKKEGLIKLSNFKITFKESNEEAYGKKIKITNLNNFVIDVDSFFVANIFKQRDVLVNDNKFLLHLGNVNDYVFAKEYTTKGNGAYYTRKKNEKFWTKIPSTKKYFKKVALTYFGHIPDLKHKINSKKFTHSNLPSLIKIAKNNKKYKNSKPLYFNKYWNETEDANHIMYSAKIVAHKDSLYTLDYFKNDIKIYSGTYSSFSPDVKQGDFIAYYPNKKVRKMITFKDNNPTLVQTYSQDGALKSKYKISKNRFNKINIDYLIINNKKGENIISENKKSIITYVDDYNKHTYTKEYIGSKLHSIFRVSEKNTIYQPTENNYTFKIANIKTAFTSFIDKINCEDILKENVQGIIMVSLVINKEGYIVKSKIHNKLHPKLDRIVAKFIENQKDEKNSYRVKFKPYKKNKEKQFCELIVPFQYNIIRDYKPTSNYFYDHNWFFQQQFLHQQFINNSLINIPSPGGF